MKYLRFRVARQQGTRPTQVTRRFRARVWFILLEAGEFRMIVRGNSPLGQRYETGGVIFEDRLVCLTLNEGPTVH